MSEDYRNTKYCPQLDGISDRKDEVKQAVLKMHPRAKNMYKYISQNNLPFKGRFIDAYNCKCSYCGVNIDVISRKLFEIDHFIPKTSDRFETPTQAANIENLVLSCYECNRSKSGFELPEEYCEKMHPDKSDLRNIFIRDNNYYIRITENMADDKMINEFYQQLGLESQIHRIDYLLMNMRGLRDTLKDKPTLYVMLNEAIELIQKKRT